jgi:hypothetical protein
MFAVFLKTADGEFAYGPAFGALVFIGLVCIFAWMLCSAIKCGRIPFGYAGTYGCDIIWIERMKSPVRFWLIFIFYSLFVAFCMFTSYALCTGFFVKSQ